MWGRCAAQCRFLAPVPWHASHDHHARNFQFFLNAVGHIVERDTHTHTQVGATLHATPAATVARAAAKAAKEVAKATAAKDVAKLREDVIHRHALTTEAAGSLLACKAILVIAGSLLGIGQHVVGLGCLLKLLLGSFLLGIGLALLTVGMILDSHLAVGFLELIGRGHCDRHLKLHNNLFSLP
jgi:hypothetical protein